MAYSFSELPVLYFTRKNFSLVFPAYFEIVENRTPSLFVTMQFPNLIGSVISLNI